MAATLLGVMLQLTAGLAVAAQVVVCRAPSGHVAIESVLSGDCCPAADEGPRFHELQAQTCDGCFDTPLLHAGFSTPSKAALHALAPTLWYRAQAPVLRRAPGLASPVAADASRPGRTVVLLI